MYLTVPVRYVPLKVAVPYVLKALYRTYLPSKVYTYYIIIVSIYCIIHTSTRNPSNPEDWCQDS